MVLSDPGCQLLVKTQVLRDPGFQLLVKAAFQSGLGGGGKIPEMAVKAPRPEIIDV